MKVINDEKGLTLIEVVASLVIISIILFGFFSLLLSGAKSTKNAENMFNSTYYAQQIMEQIYDISKNTNWAPTIIENVIPTTTFEALQAQDDVLAEYKCLDPSNGFYYTFRVKKHDISKIPISINKLPLTNVIIEVRESENGPIKMKMENIVEWQGI